MIDQPNKGWCNVKTTRKTCVVLSMQENKTPYELAIEQNHPNVAAMIADLRDNGPLVLTKYERKKRSSSQVRTYTACGARQFPETCRGIGVQWNPSNMDTNGPEESVLFIVRCPGLKYMQE